MTITFSVLAAGVLGLQTNVKSFPWSYGIIPPPVSQAEYEACDIRLRLTVGDIEFPQKNDRLGKYHYFSGRPEEDKLYYQRPFFFGSDLQLKVEGLVAGSPHLIVNKSYFRFVKYRFMNLYSPGYILTDIASLMLLRQDYAPLHCSAFRHNNATVVVFAPPNTGKTLTTMTMCAEFGADFISEDMAITDGNAIFSVPWTSTFRYYDTVESRRRVKMVNHLTQKIPILELASLVKADPIDKYLGGSEKMLATSDVTNLVILERDDAISVQSVSRDEAFRKISNLNRYEFKYHMAPISVAYEFFNRSLNLNEAVQSENRILQRLIDNARDVMVVKSPDATKYAELIVDAIDRS